MSDAEYPLLERNQNCPTVPDNFDPINEPDDELLEEVETVLRDIYETGVWYVKSRDIVDELGLEGTQGNHTRIGKRLEKLADRRVVERWSSGNSPRVWRITDEVIQDE